MSLAWKLLKADLRSGEIRILFFALFLAVSVATGLTLFIERLQVMLVGESSQFLAADRALSSPKPVDPAWLQQAGDVGLQTARYLRFQSMLYAGDEPLLVSIKAANDPYPLLGELQYRSSLYGKLEKTTHGPSPGEIWAEARLFRQLKLDIGDRVFVGDTELTLAAELVSEPDRGAAYISMGPRVLMHWDDIESTGVVQQGSRLKYYYLFSGPVQAIDSFEQWLDSRLSDSHKWMDLENTQPRVAVALKRAKNFFLLASSIIIILASVAIAIASHRFSQRHIEHVAVLKTLGASAGRISHIYRQIILLLFVITLLLAWLFAWFIQEQVLRYAASNLQVDLPPIVWQPFILGAMVAILTLCAFTLPAINSLKSAPAIAVFTRSQESEHVFSRHSLWLGFSGLLLVLILYTRQPIITLLLLLVLFIMVFLLTLPARYLISSMASQRLDLGTWKSLAVSNLKRRLMLNAVYVSIFAIALTLLVSLFGIKQNLFNEWRNQLPPETPNFFLVNINPEMFQAVDQWLADNQVQSENLYPMVRARMIKVNNEPVLDYVSKEELDDAGADRELNLSWSSDVPPDNKIVKGQWWESEERTDGVSVEEQLARKLDLQIGDVLTFKIAAEQFESTIMSIRSVEWDRMRPNFYMLLSPEQLNDYPKTFMTSFYLPAERHQLVTDLVRQFPTVVLIELDSLIQQIRSIIRHVSMALEFVLVFVVLGSLLVMIATVQGSLYERRYENTIIRTLGGTRGLITGSLIAEFALLGLMAGLFATVFSELILILLQLTVFNMSPGLHPGLWWIAPLTGALLVGLSGYLSARHVVSTQPISLLRET